MNFKPKFKPKLLLKKAVALLTATATAISLAVPSFALTGNGEGDSGGVNAGAYTYGLPGYNVSWRADLYVSANSNGKIDVDRDKIGSSALPYMGSVYYDNALDNLTYWKVPAKDIWISTDYTAERKALVDGKQANQSGGFITGYSYALPNIAHVDSLTSRFTDSAGHTVAFTNYPSGINCVNMCDMNPERYKNEVQSCIEDNTDGTPSTFLTRTIGLVNNALGGGSSLVLKALNVVGEGPKSKVSELAKTKTQKEALDCLLPTAGKNCVVEWCVIVSPMANWMEREGEGSYWLGYQNGKLTLIGGANADLTVLSMDSFTTAQYNRTSRYLYADPTMKEWINNQGCTINKKYITESLFFYEYGRGITSYIASVAHDTHKAAGSTYCGVATSKDKDNSYWKGSEENMASSGGITVYKNEIEDTSKTLPVYYYVYDPDDKDPDMNAVLVKDTADKNTAFTPKTQLTDSSGETFEVMPLSMYSARSDTETYSGGILKYLYAIKPGDTIYQTRKDTRGYPRINDGLKGSRDDGILINNGYFRRSLSCFNGFDDFDATVVWNGKGMSSELEYVYDNFPPEAYEKFNEYMIGISCERERIPLNYLTAAKSIHVMVVKKPTVKLEEYTYTYLKPDDVSNDDFMKQIENGSVEPASISKTVRKLEITDNNGVYVASDDSVLKGDPIHISALAATGSAKNDKLYKTYDECPDCVKPSIKTSKSFLVGAAEDDVSTAVDLTRTRHIWVKTVVIKKAPPAGQSAKDRIKTYDVTQLIEDTQQTVDSTGGIHLKDPASKAAKTELNNYNKNNFSSHTAHSSHSSETAIAIITNLNNPEATNKDVKALNYLNGTTSACSASCSVAVSSGHTTSCYTTNDDGSTTKTCGATHHHTSHSWSCPAKKATCHWTEESVVVVFGKQTPTQKQKSEKSSDGKSIQDKTDWVEPTTDDNKWSEVGFVINSEYYATNEVVKLHPSGSPTSKVYESGKTYYFLPKLDSTKAKPDKHNIVADEFATFDLLLGKEGNTKQYWLRYVDSADTNIAGNGGDGMQYAKASTQDKKDDMTNSGGGTQWDYLSGNKGMKIDGAKFISHRDLLSGDNIASSLVVSGYMAKYGYNAQTADYLKFMQKAGFTFTGMDGIRNISGQSNAATTPSFKYVSGEDNTANHTTRVLDIANELVLTGIKASATGNGASEYNTTYQGGNKNTLADQYKVRFGLGGLKADGGDIFKYIPDNNLGDLSLNTTDKNGDASRSTWYYATYGEGNQASCYGTISTVGSDHSGTACGSCGTSHTTHTCPYKTNTHTTPHAANVAACLSNNKYAAQGQDIFISDMKKSTTHSSKDISGGSQTGAIEKIETSRLSFLINLGVEGTIAGVWDADNSDGLNYNKDELEVAGGVLKYKATPTKNVDEEKTWREPTFELVQTHYSDVGSANTSRDSKHSEVLAEFRYSIPTQAFKFNPSYYMQFDKGFDQKDQNQAVWMLSNQPREINFKDILAVRLTQAVDKKNNSHATDITTACKNGYATVINSEWSTDKNDLTVQHATGIPTLKAGNAYTTSTEEQGGSITMYVVLQDPEFVAADRAKAVENYNKAVMQSYQKTVQNILTEMGAVATNVSAYTKRTEAGKTDYKLGLAMFTNMENGSSVNSAMQIHTNTSLELKDKEPMVINTSGKEIFSYKAKSGILADIDKPTSINYSNWTFYALQGNTFQAKLNGDTFTEGLNFDSKLDISETATVKGGTSSARKIDIDGTKSVVYSMASKDIPYYVKETLNVYNDRLTGIMSEPQYSLTSTKSKGSTTVPKNYDPYLSSDGTSKSYAFDWYGEDYEGFVVAVYNIEFDMYTKDAYKTVGGTYQAVVNTGTTTTEQSAAFRHESDWKSSTNAEADLSKYNKAEGVNMHYLETPTYKLAGVTHMFAGKNNNLKLDTYGKIMLITDTGRDILKNWADGKNADGSAMNAADAKVFKDTYAEGIYGVGMELANVPIMMENPVTHVKIGDDKSQVSFFYQPTYFNIRGSVYDTAR